MICSPHADTRHGVASTAGITHLAPFKVRMERALVGLAIAPACSFGSSNLRAMTKLQVSRMPVSSERASVPRSQAT